MNLTMYVAQKSSNSFITIPQINIIRELSRYAQMIDIEENQLKWFKRNYLGVFTAIKVIKKYLVFLFVYWVGKTIFLKKIFKVLKLKYVISFVDVSYCIRLTFFNLNFSIGVYIINYDSNQPFYWTVENIFLKGERVYYSEEVDKMQLAYQFF